MKIIGSRDAEKSCVITVCLSTTIIVFFGYKPFISTSKCAKIWR